MTSVSTEAPLHLERMRRERQAKLQSGMDTAGFDGMVLAGQSAIRYAIGSEMLVAELSRSVYEPTLAVIPRDAPAHLFTPYPEGAPPEFPVECVHPPIRWEFDDGVEALAAEVTNLLGSGELRIGFDELSAAAMELLPSLLSKMSMADAADVLGPAKLLKTADEVECIRRAQRINEIAMYDAYDSFRPGTRQSELSGVFLKRIFELGASANVVDPIWEAMAASIAEGPFTVHGDVAFPTNSTDRILRQGDLVMVDTGIMYRGYSSDFGRTWIVGGVPTPRQKDQFQRWKDVIARVLDITRPGTTGLELNQAGRDPKSGQKPWLEHFYLIHGVGTDSAEMPFIGTDLGEEFDASIVLAPGMVMVLEPVIWDDGEGGYRSEEIVVVTDDGYRSLSSFPYLPYEEGTFPW